MTEILDSLFGSYQQTYADFAPEVMSIREYLEACQGADGKDMYLTAHERLLKAIGEPELIDTQNDQRLSRVFSNRIVKVYPAFKDYYGNEAVIEELVSFLKRAAQGLEERKQILYLLGPVGGGKSTLADMLKKLMQQEPFYALAVPGKDGSPTISPVFESPLGIFSPEHQRHKLEGVCPEKRIPAIMSPWAVKRLREFGGDLSQFQVVRLHPSLIETIAISSTEPGDENNQDISALVGKTDLRQLEDYSQSDVDSYSFCGALNRANQGLMEFKEMFKAPIKTLNPLLFATQEHLYEASEPGISALPFDGLVIAHSNESEWLGFKNNDANSAFIDRTYIIKVPYCLRVTEEVMIYDKLIRESELGDAPCAPGTKEMLARFAVLTRMEDPGENSTWKAKMRVYDGETLTDTDMKAKKHHEYREVATVNEGMKGFSTRLAFKVLAKTFNHPTDEVSANPVHLLYVLEDAIEQQEFPPEQHKRYVSEFIKGILVPEFSEFIGKEIQKAYLESYSEYGQNIFDRYVTYADYWIQSEDYRDKNTGEIFDRKALNAELEKIEKPAGISNAKEFRNEIVTFVLRARANNNGDNPKWTSYKKLAEVIEKKMFSNTEELLPVISFNTKGNSEEQKKHDDFVTRMEAKGYTRTQIQLLVDWHLRTRKHK